MHFHRLRRRDLIVALGCAVMPAAIAFAQQRGKAAPRVGLLLAGAADASRGLIDAFEQGLRAQRLQPDRDVVLIVAGSRPDGDVDRAAAELGNAETSVCVAGSVREVRALLRAAPDKPVVMVAVGDPVGMGLVASLERPGGNVTGLSDFRADFADQRLRLLQELLPDLGLVGFIHNPEAPTARLIVEAADRLHIRLVSLGARTASEITSALALAARAPLGALLAAPYPASYEARRDIGTWAAARDLPVLFGYADFMDLPAQVAGLASFGANLAELYRRAAGYVAEILRGARPRDLPVGQPEQGQLIVNLLAARRLRIEVPEAVLQRADAIIR
jgi:putative tryptophan/tyrosine transport system substrate-binding protein